MGQQGALEEKTVNSIWSAFGAYLARQLRNGKGVGIPKFGNFTFTSAQVDLAVSTPILSFSGHYEPGRPRPTNQGARVHSRPRLRVRCRTPSWHGPQWRRAAAALRQQRRVRDNS